MVNNLFNQQWESHGYSFGYISGGGRIQENFYFPQAGRNFLAGISVRI
jgi:iron complex outermembrane receptor protein